MTAFGVLTYDDVYGLGTSDDDTSHPNDVVLTRVADVLPQQVEWLWARRIPRGKLALLDGDPAQGKSTMALDLVARITAAAPWPDGAPPLVAPAACLLMTAEDGIADTVRPRLDAAGADPRFVHVWESVLTDEGLRRPPSLPRDVHRLERAIRKTGAVLVVVDVLMAYLDSSVDTHRDQAVRAALMQLADVADRTNAAILVLRHLSKAGGSNALYRGGGSIGIVGAARAAMLVGQDPDDDGRRILAQTKSNLGEMPPSLAYRLVTDERHHVGRICWEGTTGHKASDLLTPCDPGQTLALDDACSFLRAVLADGPQCVKNIQEEARKASMSWATIRRAQKRLGLRAVKFGRPGERDQGWKWSLPEGAQPAVQDGHLQVVSMFGDE